MSTVLVYPPADPRGFGRYHFATRTARPLTHDTAVQVVTELAADGILVAALPGRVVRLEALVPLTTLQEVRATAAFAAVTDSRLAWCGAVT